MFKYDKREGWKFIEEKGGKHYSLYEMFSYKGTCTSDTIVIWDDDNNCFVDYLMGATIFAMEEIAEDIARRVEEYETKTLGPAMVETEVFYKLSDAGIKAWSNDVVEDICEKELWGDYIISHGNRGIRLPDLAEVHNMLEVFLEDVKAEVEESC